jgi:hypothetical protein
MKKHNQHNKNIGSKIERSEERIGQTGEVFTPMELCFEIIDSYIPIEDLQNPESTFIDPAAGNGNFIVAIKERLLQYHSEQHVVDSMIYAVELMEDNHREMCERLCVDVNHPHIVCADSTNYDFSFGKPQGIELHMN